MATEVEKIQKMLEELGFRQITEEDKNKEWYKAAIAPVPCLEEKTGHTFHSIEPDIFLQAAESNQ